MANFSDYIVSAVWNKADAIDGYDMNMWRKDFAGAWIRRNHYGLEFFCCNYIIPIALQ